MDKEISNILMLLENIELGGSTSVLTGASMAQDEQVILNGSNTEEIGYGNDAQPEDHEFSELELKLCKRFLELVGGAERARDLIDKTDDCQECLGLIDDEDDQIERISQMVPLEVDFATGPDLSPMYNPNAY